ncbi:hypothetical protein [Nitrosomonas sp. Nm34]|uniref:hypothetical protein n=1 Tax=Nitrosomonas sp. Nm34 TaxID=1881055 RepID=UPI001C317AA0|nr:hypothetical protein [Nitrosomonas sp. Nm34]
MPVAFRVIHKPIQFCDVTTRQVKRASVVTKNELMREMLITCVLNAIKFRFMSNSRYVRKGEISAPILGLISGI